MLMSCPQKVETPQDRTNKVVGDAISLNVAFGSTLKDSPTAKIFGPILFRLVRLYTAKIPFVVRLKILVTGFIPKEYEP